MARRVLGEEERADRAAALAIDRRIGLVGAARLEPLVQREPLLGGVVGGRERLAHLARVAA